MRSLREGGRPNAAATAPRCVSTGQNDRLAPGAVVDEDSRVTGAGWAWVIAALAVSLAASVTIRAAVFHHSVIAGTPWRTACPSCEAPLVRPGWGLVASALRPSGRCPRCATSIGPPVAVVEVLAAIAVTVLAWRGGAHVATIALVWSALVAVALALIDLAVHRLPDRLILAALGGTLVAFCGAVLSGTPYHRLLVALACALGAGAFYFVLVFVSPRGMGLGDAKLAVLVGLVSGWFGVGAAVLAVMAGVLFAGLAAIMLVITRRVARADRLAYGPFMLMGALAAILLTH